MDKEAAKYRVVLLDDSVTECKKISQMLTSEGFEVTFFENAFMGIEFILRNTPDVVISDVIMPEMDGYEVCRYIKNNPKVAHIPVLLLTGLESKDAIIQGFQAGAFDFVNKNEQQKVLVTRVKSSIEYHNILRKYILINEELEKSIEQKTQLLIKAERQCLFAQFIHGIIHNLKNPLGSISGFAEINKHYLEIVSEKYKDNTIDTIKKNNRLIYDSIENIFTLIHSLLRKGKDNMSEQSEIVNLNDLLTKELSFFEANIFFNHKVKKELHMPDHELVINVVPSYITQVFQNLISNALDALAQTKEPKIEIITGREDDWCWFEVIDNGSGIDDEHLEKIFDAFFSTKNSGKETNQSYSGTGLGLFICKEMIESLRGTISVRSRVGEYTVFKVSLPIG